MSAPRSILVISFYFPPDLSAGSFRCRGLVDALEPMLGEQDTVSILTTMPNRYRSYVKQAEETEVSGKITIRRCPLPEHASGFVDQARAFTHFARFVRSEAKSLQYDLVLATSSRLMTAALGAYVATHRKALLYLDIRDIFVDTLSNVLHPVPGSLLGPLFRQVERWTVKQADVMNLVSGGFKDYFAAYFDVRKMRFFTNGIDKEFVEFDAGRGPDRTAEKVVLYAGNIGSSQGLDRIVPDAARLLGSDFKIVVIGDGGARRKLEEACRGVDNVELHPPVNRAALLDRYASADVLFVHLNDLDAFRKVLPSKIFEYAATGKPVLAGVAGFSANFLESEVENSAVFTPCDADGMRSALERLELADVDRRAFVDRYSREKIMQAMARDVVALLDGR